MIRTVDGVVRFFFRWSSALDLCLPGFPFQPGDPQVQADPGAISDAALQAVVEVAVRNNMAILVYSVWPFGGFVRDRVNRFSSLFTFSVSWSTLADKRSTFSMSVRSD